MSDKKESRTNGRKVHPGRGLSSLDSTTFFRVTNFELFVKPNKAVMTFGLLALTCCIGYIAYMRAFSKTDKTYIAVDEDGNKYIREKRSRWD